MSLAFYYMPMSTADITNGVLAELAIPFERVVLNIQAGGTRTPEFLAINPNGRVPAIVHDGVAIWESAAITMYLGEVFGEKAGLYPALGPKRGEAMKWIVWSNVSLAEAAGRLAYALPQGSEGGVEEGSRDAGPAGAHDENALRKAREDVAACLAILDGGLEGRSFLLADYSLADTHLQSLVTWLGMMHVDMASFPNVTAWARRCGERPALAALMGG